MWKQEGRDFLRDKEPKLVRDKNQLSLADVPWSSKGQWHHLRFTGTYPGAKEQWVLRGSEQNKSSCHQELEPGRGGKTNTLGTVPGKRWQSADQQCLMAPRTQLHTVGTKKYLLSEWAFIPFKALSRWPEEKLCEVRVSFSAREQSQPISWKTTKLGEEPANAGNPEATGELSCGCPLSPSTQTTGCSCSLTYMTIMNTPRPVTSASGLPWFWGTQPSDSKNTNRLQDRLNGHPLSQGRHPLSLPLTPPSHASPHMIRTPHREGTWPL